MLRTGRSFSVLLALISLLLGLVQPHSNAVNYTVTYYANENQYQIGVTTGAVPGSASYASGSAVSVASNSGSLSRAGFTFTGWNTLSSGLGTHYNVGDSFSLTSNTSLYADWAIPQSARLIGQTGTVVSPVNSNSVLNGGKCLSNVRGITADNDYIYYRSSIDGAYICKVSFSGVIEEAMNIGTSLSNIPLDSMAISYSSGCIFIRNGGGAGSSINCIDVSDKSFTNKSLPAGKGILAGQGWLSGNLIAFPDGRIGAVSQPNQTLTVGTGAGQCPSGLFCKILRLYKVSGTGKNFSLDFSEDIILADNVNNWPTDDHGIATDGTYLYQINYSSGYKVYALASGSPSYLVFNAVNGSGCGTTSPAYCPINTPNTGLTLTNGTYIGRSHSTNQYYIGDYDSSRFWISASIAPPQGPGSAPPGTVGAPTSVSTLYKGINATVTVTSSVAGKLAFYFDGKRITTCRAVPTTGTSPNFTASCTWKPAVTAYHDIYAVLTPTNTALLSSKSAIGRFYILKRTTTR